MFARSLNPCCTCESGILEGVRVLGANGTTTAIFFALSDERQIRDGLTDRVQPPAGLEVGAGLVEFLESMGRVLNEAEPDLVLVLLPESQSTDTYRRHLPRATMETLLRLAAAQSDIPLEQMSRPMVRSRLGLPRRGSLMSHLDAAGEAVGRYWTTGRGLAALTALAGHEDR